MKIIQKKDNASQTSEEKKNHTMNKIYTRKENTSQTWQLLGLQTYTRNDNTKQTWG